MGKVKEPVNPFYILLVILGIAFFITAVAYWQMAYRAIARPREADAPPPATHQLMVFMDEQGMNLLIAELVLLGGATCGAMWLDQYRMNQQQQAEAGRAGKDGSQANNGDGGPRIH